MSEIFRINSVSEVLKLLNLPSSKNPLIGIIKGKELLKFPLIKGKIITNLYSINYKIGNECHFLYGRNNYDFQKGSIICLSPNQVIEPEISEYTLSNEGWNLIFHSDIIHNTLLSKSIDKYTFFNYESCEALYLSEDEEKTIHKIINLIEQEIEGNMDDFTQLLIVKHIDLLLGYIDRFYSRQFITRKNINNDVLIKFEKLLNSYFNEKSSLEKGLPTVSYFSKKMGYSSNYLSDLIKKETGKTVKEHINYKLIEISKKLLLGTEKSIKNIAYELGFITPQHFTVFFNKKIGSTPSLFRKNKENL